MFLELDVSEMYQTKRSSSKGRGKLPEQRSPRLAQLIRYATRHGWCVLTDGQRFVLISRTGARITLGMPPVAR